MITAMAFIGFVSVACQCIQTRAHFLGIVSGLTWVCRVLGTRSLLPLVGYCPLYALPFAGQLSP